MRPTCTVYVDAGYLLASAATRVTGTSLRNGIYVNYPTLIQSLIERAEEISGLPLLRVYWYDSAKDGVPDAQQERIGALSRVKLRLGRFGYDGQQKGVDLRIGLDMVNHARNSAATVFYLVSGDDDLTEAVEEAQAHGVQVAVLAVPGDSGEPHGIAKHLVRAADDVSLLSTDCIDQSVTAVTQQPTTPSPLTAIAGAPMGQPHATPLMMDPARRPVAEPAPVLAYSGTTGSASQVSPDYDPDLYADEIELVAKAVLASYRNSAAPAALDSLENSRPSIPQEVDAALLRDLSSTLGRYELPEPVRYRLRAQFWAEYDQMH
mgnify:CR=1 FL=1